MSRRLPATRPISSRRLPQMWSRSRSSSSSSVGNAVVVMSRILGRRAERAAVGGEVEHGLAAVEALGVAARRVGLHPAQTHHGHERLPPEPVLVVLAGEALEDVGHLRLVMGRLERDEQIRRAEVAVVLRDLLFQDEMTAEGVPGELADQPVVLVEVAPGVREHEIGLDAALELFEELLDARAFERKEAVAKVLDHALLVSDAAQEPLRARSRL